MNGRPGDQQLDSGKVSATSFTSQHPTLTPLQPNGSTVSLPAPVSVINVEATQKYIGVLEEKIREYERALDGVQHQIRAQASRAVVELDSCSSADCAKQERTKRRLELEHGELKSKAQKLQRNVRKLEYKLRELRTNGIPRDVVPEDYVRQLERKDVTGAAVSTSSAGSSLSAGPRRAVASFVDTSQAPALAAAVVHRTASSSDLLPGPSRLFGIDSPVSRQQLPDDPAASNAATSAVSTVISASSIVGGGVIGVATSSEADRFTLSSSDPASSPPLLLVGPPQQQPPFQPISPPPHSSASPSTSFETVENLRLHFERRLMEQRAAFAAELESLRRRASDEAGDIQRLVDAELRNLRYDQHELSASADDGHKELEKMKVFLTNLSKEMGRMLLVDQQIDDMNNRLAVISRDLVLQSQAACSGHHHGHHHHPDGDQGGAAAGARLLNMLVALLSYAFVAASCFVNLLLWLLRLPARGGLLGAICLAAFAIPLILIWLDGGSGGGWLTRVLPEIIVRHLPLSARRQLTSMLMRLNATLT